MKNFAAPAILLIIFGLSLSYSEPVHGDTAALLSNRNAVLEELLNEDQLNDDLLESLSADKRVERYGFGLGRRAYTYTNGGGNGNKRLPVYNFGLGKRGRPYSFGLGKRNDFEDYADFADDKRNRPYSFGLGKRMVKRSAQRENFDLGR